jgi:hypothetical protein
MATVARHGGRNVCDGLAHRDALVMAIRTCSRLDAVVGKEGWFPVRCSVAAIAIDGRGNVVRRLERRDHPPPW